MATKKQRNTSKSTYVPFRHDNFEYTKNIIELARKQRDSNTVEGSLAAALIYVNAVEYVSKHVLENLSEIVQMVSNESTNGGIYLCSSGKADMPLGKLLPILENYEFPNKRLFIDDLKLFKPLREKLAHQLLRLTKEEVEKIDDELNELKEIAERILNHYDTTVKGITENWNNYCSRTDPSSSEENRDKTEESKKDVK